VKIEIIQKETPDLKDPIVICGLPGSALVGKLAVDHLISELGAKLLAEIFCDALAPQVIIRDDGTVSLMRNELFYWKNPVRNAKDLVFYTGDAQPGTSESEYAVAHAIVSFLMEKYHSNRLISLGAFVTGKRVAKPQTYAAATEKNMANQIAERGCIIMDQGAITGMNGLLIGVAGVMGLSGYTLLGETSGYLFDPKASEAVLVSLSKIEGISVNMRKLHERAKEVEVLLRSIERTGREGQNPLLEGRRGQELQSPAEQTDERKKLDYIS